ncbi:MAG: glycosyltransferase family 2 protein [Melioribacteraceae bacterium]|nr:glycosyltransferase family 2 protein [Melioribacteraceae bacterium]
MLYNKDILISVVIPTYNRAFIIKKCLDSVLEQTFHNLEVLVVDDGSTDNTKEVVESINDSRINFIESEKNGGACAARNIGINAAKGDYIAFLDSDDYWLKDKLEKQINCLKDSGDDTTIIHCGYERRDVDSGELVGKRIVYNDVQKEVFSNLGAAPGTPSLLIKRDILLEIGGFDENLPAHQETELAIRLAKKYNFKLVDEYLAVATVNHTRISSNPVNRINAKEIIYHKHKDLLSKRLNYGLCSAIAGFRICEGNFKSAKVYLRKSFKYDFFNIKIFFSIIMMNISPTLNQSLYLKKYKKLNIID